jgi:hypothetical protein
MAVKYGTGYELMANPSIVPLNDVWIDITPFYVQGRVVYKTKIGNGRQRYSQLPYDTNSSTVPGSSTPPPTPSGGGISGPGTTTPGYIPLWGDLTGTTLGSGIPVTAFATSAQGALADTALQPGDVQSFTMVAGAAIGGQRLLMNVGGLAYHFDPTNIANAGRCLGLSNAAVTGGATVEVISAGKITSAGWGIFSGSIYFAASNGLMTTTPPVSGVSQRAGVGVDTNTLNVQLSEPLIIT